MCRTGLIISLLLLLLLSGCSQASQVENHAYVLVMGLDKYGDGQMKMTVQIPQISGNAAEEENSGKNGNYMKLSVSAENYEAALEKLDWASPRDLNLSQIKLIVLSRELAESEECTKLIENIAQTERLYTATRVAVCEGSAEEFVAAIEPKIGTRISTDIDAMFEHYISRGYVPQSSLAELFYLTKSIYSDPMVTYALLKDGQKQVESSATEEASALSGSVESVSESYDSDISTRFLGAAVFVDGRMRGVLNGTQTVIAALLRNEIDSMRYECDGQSLTIVPARPVYIRVDAKNEPICIHINAKLSLAAQEELPDEEKLRSSLEKDIRETIESARQMDAEPFGFAEKAAQHFLTIADWQNFDWDKHYANAEFEIDLSFANSDA